MVSDYQHPYLDNVHLVWVNSIMLVAITYINFDRLNSVVDVDFNVTFKSLGFNFHSGQINKTTSFCTVSIKYIVLRAIVKNQCIALRVNPTLTYVWLFLFYCRS